jgi:hypothetical protein
MTANVSMGLPGDEKEERRAKNHATGRPVSDLTEELTEFLGEELMDRGQEVRLPKNGWFAFSDADLRQKLRHYQGHLDTFVTQVPRGKDESLGEYVRRLARQHDSVQDILSMIANIDAHFALAAKKRFEEMKKAAEAKRQEEERDRQRRLEERRKREREASPDPKEIKRLLAVIAEAEEIEALVALRDKAQEARGALVDIFTSERDACKSLGKPVPERSVPGWPNALNPRR